MFNFILLVILGGNSVADLAASLFWPFVSISDLIKITALLLGASLVELWVRGRRNKASSRRDA